MMKIHLGAALCVCGSVVCLILAGCGSGGADIGAVSGAVTLDGQPLADAVVQFEPEAKGLPSTGVTDAAGKYRLMLTHDKPGAKVGKYRVRIATNTYSMDASGNETELPQRVPPKYNTKSELTAEVNKGSNALDFELTSQ